MSPGNARGGQPLVRVEHDFAVPLTTVWDSLTLPEHISVWFTRCERVSRDEYRLSFDEDDGVHVKTAAVQWAACTGPRRGVAMELHDPGHAVSAVRVSVRDSGDGIVRMRLDHIDPPPELIEGYHTGWRDYVRALSAFVAEADTTPTPSR